ncbi:MAG: flagellin FliC, partial [Proteobacteria bacterium]|nr:flagellin FliC [Pseudomonadota bacterium]
MGLRINTNIPALNAARTLRRNTSALNQSLERLSSGLRINSGRDDPAGCGAGRASRCECLPIAR